MTKRKGLFDIDVDVKGLLEELPNSSLTAPKVKNTNDYYVNYTESMLISQALEVITRQMRVSGNRSRTISDYVLHVEHFQGITHTKYIEDITANTIYSWLDSMNVSNQTKLTRLRSP